MADDWHVGTVMSLIKLERMIRVDDRTFRYADSLAPTVQTLRPGMAVRYQASPDGKTLLGIGPKESALPAPTLAQTPAAPAKADAPAQAMTAPASTGPATVSPPPTPWGCHEEYTVTVGVTVNLDNYENIRLEFSGKVRCQADIDRLVLRADETLGRFGNDAPTKAKVAAYRNRVIGGVKN